MSKTVEGIYRNGKVELLETPPDVTEADLRARLQTFAEDWERLEMGAYDAL